MKVCTFFIVHVSIIHRPHVYCMWYSLFTIRMFNWTWLSFWLKMTGIMLCKDKDRAFLKDDQEFVKTVFLGVIGLLVWIMMLYELHAEKPWVFIIIIGRWQGFELCNLLKIPGTFHFFCWHNISFQGSVIRILLPLIKERELP